MISKADNLADVANRFPEVAPVLGAAGLHCIGCHVSAVESIEQGCKGHGMKDQEIEDLIEEANLKIEEKNHMAPISFNQRAVIALKEKLAKNNSKYIKIIPAYGGFEFDVIDEKDPGDILIKAGDVEILAEANIERLVRGVRVAYSEEKKDFVAED